MTPVREESGSKQEHQGSRLLGWKEAGWERESIKDAVPPPSRGAVCRRSPARSLTLSLTGYVLEQGPQPLSLLTDQIETQHSSSLGCCDNRLVGGKHPLQNILSLSWSFYWSPGVLLNPSVVYLLLTEEHKLSQNPAWELSTLCSLKGRNPCILPSRPAQFCFTTSHPLGEKA